MINHEFRISIPLFVLGIFLINIAEPVTAISFELDEHFPKNYNNEEDAKSNGCTIVHLKGKNQKSCVFQKNLFHGYSLIIYDSDSKGVFIQAEQFCIPSWYQEAKINYKDLLGNGRQFLIAEFEGNTGTATLQMILFLIFWNGSEFIPVLAETISYNLGSMYLTSNYSLINVGTPMLKLQLNYELIKEDERTQMEFTTTWNEVLEWDNEQLSFYNAEHEENMLESPSYNRRKIASVRLSMNNIRLNDLCGETFFE